MVNSSWGDDFDLSLLNYGDEFKQENLIDLRDDVSAHPRLRVEAERPRLNFLLWLRQRLIYRLFPLTLPGLNIFNRH
ncbi:MAG: hypothetical protein CM1200mP39_11390 [Dehalococcoidia bacterium]|nr:MAG: hypothetical protein CM1200mP39_11390 [Dehalococcoidia bacterium]